VFGSSPLVAGLAFLPMTVVNFVVALAVPHLTRRFGNTALLVVLLALALVVSVGCIARMPRLGRVRRPLTEGIDASLQP